MSNTILQNQELVQISETEINGVLTKTINARDLHSFLEVGRDFSNWIKNRISTLGSIENEDYAVISGKNLLAKIGEEKEDERGGSNKIDYLITIDLAKHIAMMEKNERGYQIRNYFIQCEKKLKEAKNPEPIDELLMISRIAMEMYETKMKTLELEKRVKKLEDEQIAFDNKENFFTIKGFCSLHNLKIPSPKMSSLSKKVKKHSIAKGYIFHEIADSRYGKVKCYHIDILEDVFEAEGSPYLIY